MPTVSLPRLVQSVARQKALLSDTNGQRPMLICARFNPPVQDAVQPTEKTRNILPKMMITTVQPPLIAVFAEKKFWRQVSILPKRMTAIAQQSKNAPYAVKWRLQRRTLTMTLTTTTFATTQAVR